MNTIPSKTVTVAEVLLREPTTPLTHDEQQLATKLMQRKIETEKNKTIQLHTKKKVCSLFVYLSTLSSALLKYKIILTALEIIHEI